MERAIIIFNRLKTGESIDLDIPLNITANDLLRALNKAFDLGIDTSRIQNCYLKADNPKVLLRGNKELWEFGIYNGSIINFTD